MMKRTAWAAATIVLGLGAAGTTGCSRYSAYCTDQIDCRRGNDADIEACIINLDRLEERADIWGCTDDWDRYFECLEDRARCRDRDWTTDGDCNRDSERYSDCTR